MGSQIEDIRAVLHGRTGMSEEIEKDLFKRIAEIEECRSMIKPMTKVDLISGLAFALLLGVLPVVLVGLGIW